MSERCERTSERRSEWPSTLRVDFIVILPIADCFKDDFLGKDLKSTRKVLGHLFLRSLARSHRSLIRLLRTARFARALRCAYSFARSLTPELMVKSLLSVN